MSTRAIYTFKDKHNTVHVYKHNDGYPSGGLHAIEKATLTAWCLPRFEADEFAAAFVAENKDTSGGVRLIAYKEPHEFATDTEYLYEVTVKNGELHVRIFEAHCGRRKARPIFSGYLDKAIEKFTSVEEK